MRKAEQMAINEECMEAIEKYNKADNKEYYNRNRLDYCNAYTYETKSYICLISYHTLIAFIDKANGIMYDVLRYVYGYTATSAKHISKFRRFKHTKELTYR